MTLLEKIEDTEEGLIGTTENGEQVKLGVPRTFSYQGDYGYSCYRDALKAFSPKMLKKDNEKKMSETYDKMVKSYRRSDAYYFIEPKECVRLGREAYSIPLLIFPVRNSGKRKKPGVDVLENSYSEKEK